MLKIVSGGQTGVDRAALDVALELGLATGGWIPRGRRAEDGRIPDRYPGLHEAGSSAYDARTELNVRDSDATLVLCAGQPSGGTALTVRLAREMERPLLVVDLDADDTETAARRVRDWIARSRVRVLNVAGPRASQGRELGARVSSVLRRALRTGDAA